MKNILSLIVILVLLIGCNSKAENEIKAESLRESMKSELLIGEGELMPGTTDKGR